MSDRRNLCNDITQLDDKVHNLVLQHCLRVEIGDQERDVVALHVHWPPYQSHRTVEMLQRTLTGFLLKTTKLSARCIINLVNL
jgi:hypothetical protein